MPYITSVIDKQLRLRDFEKKQAYMPVGSAMKARRIERGWTLEEVCENICSVSYLSKLENNHVELSDKFSAQLFKKLGLEDYQFTIHDRTEKDLAHLLQMLHEKGHDGTFFYERYKDKLDYQSRLICMVLAFMDDDIDQTDRLYHKLLPYVSQFTDYETSIFIYVISFILYDQGLYEQSYQMFLRSPHKSVNDKTLSIISDKLNLFLLFRLYRHNEIRDLYQSLFQTLAMSHLYEDLKIIQIELMIYQTQFRSIDDIKSQIEHIHQMDGAKKAYILARSYYRYHLYEEAFNCLNQYHHDTHLHMQLYLLILDRLHKLPEIIMEVINRFDSEKLEDVQLKRYLSNKHILDDHTFAEYLKQEYFSQTLIVEDAFILSFLALDGQEKLSQSHFYKDAAKVMHHYLRTTQ